MAPRCPVADARPRVTHAKRVRRSNARGPCAARPAAADLTLATLRQRGDVTAFTCRVATAPLRPYAGLLAAAAATARAQLDYVTPPQWDYVFADPTITVTPRSTFIAAVNATSLVVTGGETATGTTTLPTLTYTLPPLGTGQGAINAEVPATGLSIPRGNRAAFASFTPPTTYSATVPNYAPVGTGAYVLSFSGLSNAGAETAMMHSYNIATNNWTYVAQAGTIPNSRQG